MPRARMRPKQRNTRRRRGSRKRRTRNRILRRKRRNDSRNLLLLLLMPLVPWAPRLEHSVVAVGGCRLLSDPRAASR